MHAGHAGLIGVTGVTGVRVLRQNENSDIMLRTHVEDALNLLDVDAITWFL
jgi:hypothetical protein